VPPSESHLQSTFHFGAAEWSLSLLMALVWGSSFLWIAIAIDHVSVTVVPLARVVFGALALSLVPAARTPIDRVDAPRFALLGLVWMAVPFLLYPIAERTVSSSVTGMINGGLPVVTTVVAACFAMRRPSGRRITAVLVGFFGIALIAGASAGGVAADALGIGLLLVALFCYALAANLAVVMQAKYNPLSVMFHMELFAVAWSLPLGVHGLTQSSWSWEAFWALLVLGAVGTGAAFAIYGVLLHRAGPVRGMIGIFFTPIVGTFLGVIVRDESLPALAVVGMAVVIVGAYLTSRPEPLRTSESAPTS
jgi:drug/metabolite transporter (DMT)-like permease